jgi:hypothetical protein
VPAASCALALTESAAFCAGSRSSSVTCWAVPLASSNTGCAYSLSSSLTPAASRCSGWLGGSRDAISQPRPKVTTPAASGLPSTRSRAACGAEAATSLTVEAVADAAEETLSAAPDI